MTPAVCTEAVIDIDDVAGSVELATHGRGLARFQADLAGGASWNGAVLTLQGRIGTGSWTAIADTNAVLSAAGMTEPLNVAAYDRIRVKTTTASGSAGARAKIGITASDAADPDPTAVTLEIRPFTISTLTTATIPIETGGRRSMRVTAALENGAWDGAVLQVQARTGETGRWNNLSDSAGTISAAGTTAPIDISATKQVRIVVTTASGTANSAACLNLCVAPAERIRTSRLLGRGSTGEAGHPQEISLGTGLSMSGATIGVPLLGTGIFNHLCRRRFWVTPVRGSTSRNLVGASGASSYATVGTTADEADGAWQSQTTGTVSGNYSGAGGPNATTGSVQTRWAPVCAWAFKTPSDITNLRLTVGLSNNGTGVSSNADTNAGDHSAYIRFSTSAGDGGWKVHTSNGASATVSAQVHSIAADTAYYLVIDATDSAAIKFYMGTSPESLSLVHTATATLPSTSTAMYVLIPGVTTLTNAARSIKWGLVYGTHK